MSQAVADKNQSKPQKPIDSDDDDIDENGYPKPGFTREYGSKTVNKALITVDENNVVVPSANAPQALITI